MSGLFCSSLTLSRVATAARIHRVFFVAFCFVEIRLNFDHLQSMALIEGSIDLPSALLSNYYGSIFDST